MSDTYLTAQEAGDYLRLSKSSLAKLRLYGGGPRFIRVSGRKITYRQSDLDAWVAAREHQSTSEYVTIGGAPRQLTDPGEDLPATTSS